ncbi:MAG: cytochrome C assembly protein [Chloroflexi bacterium]|nr:cytochrome C assembly protein [Chloroflexota bacterium]
MSASGAPTAFAAPAPRRPGALARLYGRRWGVLPPLTAVGMFAMIAGAVIAAPREIVEGEVQRLMYIHVPSAWSAYLSFTIVFVASIVVLWRRDMRWDAVARGAAAVGVLFTALTLATGAIWGRPIWGVYWTWDARLTATLVLLLIFSVYLLARSVAGPNDEQGARYAAVFAIIGFLDIPLIHMSVNWWRTLHPQPLIVRPLDRPALPGEMLLVLVISALAISLLALWLISLQAHAERLGQRAQSLQARIDRGERG